ncbi:hypothetical protein E2C01_096115 [Portunus trituberculatus]|uniref:Uncharacterized protein n=1 Tax=Portunus trituberculatus TaxID=210409 RepID=A0A5B7K109_PORTR|nr:hypothetical protein [Portunus trituberculatus]
MEGREKEKRKSEGIPGGLVGGSE